MAFRIRSSNQHQQPMAVILYSFARPAEGNTLNFYIMLMILNTMKTKTIKWALTPCFNLMDATAQAEAVGPMPEARCSPSPPPIDFMLLP